LNGWINGGIMYTLGDSVYFDQWWLILLVSRIAALLIESIHKVWKTRATG
jgi:hypothetical protein